MAYDFTTTFLEYVVDEFPSYFAQELDPDDLLLPLEVVRGPLQDDPTDRAPYLIVEPDPGLKTLGSHWRVPVTAIKRGMLAQNQDYPTPEISGLYLMINFFIMRGWMPEQDNRESAYEVGGRALRQFEMAYGRFMYDLQLAPITTDDEKETSNTAFPMIFTSDGAHFEVIGGDTTWYPQLEARFHIFSGIDMGYIRGF